MVAIPSPQRAYQLVSKAISTADEMMGIANQVKR
jgi:flagellar basal body rod protein FlgG